MKMKLNWMVLVSLAVAVACGGKKTGDSKPTVQSATKECQKACDQAAECDGAPADFAEECGESCESAVEASDEFGCLEEFETVAQCTSEEFSCVTSGDACASEAEDYASCVFDAESDDPVGDGAEPCRQSCAIAAECEDAPPNYEESCHASCDTVAEEARNAGCENEFEVYAQCIVNDFDCEAADLSCEDEAEDFSACLFD